MARWKISHLGDGYGRVASALASDRAFPFRADCRPIQGSSFLVHLQKSRLLAVAFAALYRSARRLGSQLRARFRPMESDTGAPGVLATAAVLPAARGDSASRLMQD
jgi:hypothetical protein